ncbi:MAG: gliding motility protein GldM, partial [Cyclobacteriaceae bacterium]|nr:gliding motility protein GldM [Cyclobacteriaceae bacterium]
MSGGKETPRQKMIGMMYLVLTALLALQVSNAVLEKFIFINATLEQLVNENEVKSLNALTSIDAAVVKNGNLPKHKRILDKANEVRAMTKSMIDEMNGLKDKMIQITGGRDPENPNKLLGAKDYDKVGALMLTQPDGEKFEKDLDEYVANLNRVVKESGLDIPEFHQLSRDGKDVDIFKDDPDQKNKNFRELTFMNTPTAAGLASMSQLEAEVLAYETVVLEGMAKAVDAVPVAFNIIVPMVKPRSEVVAAGDDYTADLFITASAEGIDPVMTLDGKPLKVEKDENGIMMGKISIPARGEGEKSFTAAITMNDTTFTRTMKYTVMTPTISITAAGLSALYENCANPLDVQVPMLGANYDPSFSASNGKAVKGPK